MPERATIFDEADTRPGRFGPVLFALTLLVATLLYIATGEMILAILLPCLHGGWSTFRTGFWLLNVDPRKRRACICFAFYMAAACWKAAAAAFTFILLAMITGIEPNMKDVDANLLVLASGTVCNTIVGLIAICAALFFEIRVWVHPRLRKQVQGDLSLAAKLEPRQSGFNCAIFVVGTALVFPPIIADVIYFAVQTIDRKVNAPVNASHLMFMLLVLFGGPLAMIPCYAWLSSRIIARSPRECWPEGTVIDDFSPHRHGTDE